MTGSIAVFPSLFLDSRAFRDFPNGVPPFANFARASGATYFDAAGVLRAAPAGAARHDHDPATGKYLGWLIEEARTNLLLRSEELDNASWTKSNATVTANAIASPVSGVLADTLVSVGAGTGRFVSQSLTVAAGSVTASVFYKKGTVSFGVINLYDGTNGKRQWFNLNTGTLGTANNIGSGLPQTGQGIQALPDGWFRCWMTLTFPGTAVISQFMMGGSDLIETVANNDTLHIVATQVEQGSFPTSYIPTAGATATRSADVLSIATSGFTFNANEGTLFVVADYTGINGGSVNGVASIDNGSTNYAGFFFSNGAPYCQVVASSVNVANLALAAAPGAGVLTRMAMAYRVNDFAAVCNGGAPVVDTSGALPSFSQITIGSLAGVGSYGLSGHIRQVAYFPRRLSNVDLQTITGA